MADNNRVSEILKSRDKQISIRNKHRTLGIIERFWRGLYPLTTYLSSSDILKTVFINLYNPVTCK